MTHLDKAKRILWDLIDSLDLDHADNFRFAARQDPAAMAEFLRKADQGCCGVFERQVEIDGEQWIVGCNYGH